MEAPLRIKRVTADSAVVDSENQKVSAIQVLVENQAQGDLVEAAVSVEVLALVVVLVLVAVVQVKVHTFIAVKIINTRI